jgi:hypothetical protein
MVRAIVLVLTLGSCTLVACEKRAEAPGAIPAEAPPPEPPPAGAEKDGTLADAPAFTSVEEAQAALARAEQELLALQGGPPAATAGAPEPQAPPPQASAPADRAAEAEEKPAAKADQAAAPSCPGLCRAFASLSRAADAVCRLAGETDERCTHARSSVRTNFQRVASCRCAATD